MNNYITPKINDILKWKTVDTNTGEILWAIIRVTAIEKRDNDNDEDFKMRAVVLDSNHWKNNSQFCWDSFRTTFDNNDWSYYGQSRRFQIYEDLKKMLTS